ncbi:MAG: hypothetical protein JXQ90_01530 [Cyclobacteriaceae bacterium]
MSNFPLSDRTRIFTVLTILLSALLLVVVLFDLHDMLATLLGFSNTNALIGVYLLLIAYLTSLLIASLLQDARVTRDVSAEVRKRVAFLAEQGWSSIEQTMHDELLTYQCAISSRSRTFIERSYFKMLALDNQIPEEKLSTGWINIELLLKLATFNLEEKQSVFVLQAISKKLRDEVRKVSRQISKLIRTDHVNVYNTWYAWLPMGIAFLSIAMSLMFLLKI